MKCPLPSIGEEDIYQGVRSLMPKCDTIGCCYVHSEWNEDPPSGCLLLVVALLDPERLDKERS